MSRGARIGIGLVVVLGSCIIPDREIEILGGPDNPGAVRILEDAPITPMMAELCFSPDDRIADGSFCPEREVTDRSSGLVASPEGPFCICPAGDDRAIAPFRIIAEDPDLEDGDPRDILYGAALLDPDPLSDTPFNDVAYQNYWEACGAGLELGTRPGLERESYAAWAFPFDDATGSERVDLCNDNNGRALDPGVHTLQFMVTDRPFFRPALRGPDGEARVDSNGDPLLGPVQCGVPDLSAGATYATINFVFECRPEDAPGPGQTCSCADEVPQ